MAENKAKQPEKKTVIETKEAKEAKPEVPKTASTASSAPQQKSGTTTGFILIALLIVVVMFIFGWGPFNRKDRVGEAVDLKGLTVSEACTKAKEKGWSNVYVTIYGQTQPKGYRDSRQGDCESNLKVYDFKLDTSYCDSINTPKEFNHKVCLKAYEEGASPEEEDAAKEAKNQEAAKKAEEEKKKAEAEKPKEDSSSSNSTSSSSSSTSSSSSSSSADEYTIPSSELYTGLAACARALTNQGYNNVNMPASSYVRGYTAGEPYKWYIVTKPTYKDKTFGSNIQLSQVVCLYNWKTGDAKITYVNK